MPTANPHSVALPLLDISYEGNQCVAFCVWLLSLSTMFAGFESVHLLSLTTSALFFAHTIACVSVLLLRHTGAASLLCWLWIMLLWTFVHVCVVGWACACSSPGWIPTSGTAGSHGNCVSHFEKLLVFQSHRAISHSAQERVRVLVSPYLIFVLLAITVVRNGISLLLWFPFLTWLMSSFLSCVHWPLMCLLWRNTYSDPLPTFSLDCLFAVEV